MGNLNPRCGAILVWAFLVVLSGCGDSCREYSDFSCPHLEKATYTVYFSFPDSNRSLDIGDAVGLDRCGSIAHNYASRHEVRGKIGDTSVASTQRGPPVTRSTDSCNLPDPGRLIMTGAGGRCFKTRRWLLLND